MIRYRKRSANGQPLRIALFPGAFNPPTVAHLELAASAANDADEVILLVAESMPHKGFERAGFEDRLAMLSTMATHPRVSVASSAQGLFVDIAASCREVHPQAALSIVCGKDAAERILHWPYADERALDRLFALSELWVFARLGDFAAPEAWRERIRCYPFSPHLQALSATEVRRRIAHGEAWKHLVPEAIHSSVEKLYGGSSSE